MGSIKIFHCFFEQSGTFKNEFRKLGYEAYDYDILNEFGETDFVIDLFNEIKNAYKNKPSIFDKITNEDTILAFYPCTRFEDQIQMGFRGTMHQMKNWSIEQKLEYDLKLHRELSELYENITKLAIVCVRKQIPLIIENPYSTTHYLVKYWAIPYSILDINRTTRGDYYKKPTQYWFINCKPKNNMILEAYSAENAKSIEYIHNKTERSMISKEYANRFIREFII
ncbi:MAG: hypothetical protein LBL91_06180 [Lachnospiraceae bacterium]|jgi:hypothetical protein|nr:hypothetical protein [Lachnospiraceae bacterium]